jgi:septal ring factor EnvC (AmiA/AmiB activator)
MSVAGHKRKFDELYDTEMSNINKMFGDISSYMNTSGSIEWLKFIIVRRTITLRMHKNSIGSLHVQLEEERKKTEDLEGQLEEEKVKSSDLKTQLEEERKKNEENKTAICEIMNELQSMKSIIQE